MSLDVETVASNMENRANKIDAAGVPEFSEVLREGAAVLREVGEDFRQTFGEDC